MKNPTIPHPPEWGGQTILRMGRDMLGGPSEYFGRYGDTFASEVFGLPLVMTRDPHWISECLVRQQSSFVKDKTTRGLSRLLGEGLLTAEGGVWRRRRKLMQPHFQPAEVESYGATFAEEAEREADLWAAADRVDLLSSMTRMTLRITLRTLFGADPDLASRFSETMHTAVAYFEGVAGTQFPLPPWVPTPTNRRFVRARASLRRNVAALIRDLEQRKDARTLLGRLLMARSEERLSEQEVIDEAVTLLVAGHETSALSLVYTLGLLAQHPMEQRTVAEELPREGRPCGPLGLRRSSAVGRALSEGLRLYPVTWAVGREATASVEVCGHPVVRGTQVYFHQWAAHRNGAWFEAPESFRPSRWLDDATLALPKGVYAPFGAGPRTCIGNHFALVEMMEALGVLLSRYRLTLASDFPGELRPSITLRPAAPVVVAVEARGS